MAKKTTKTTTTKEWRPNEKQQKFLEVLGEYPDGATLKDIELDKGVAFATGCINTLVSRGLVNVVDSVRVSDKVYRGVVIAQVKDPVKKYYLAQYWRPRRKGQVKWLDFSAQRVYNGGVKRKRRRRRK